jgi:hypothetical protein
MVSKVLLGLDRLSFKNARNRMEKFSLANTIRYILTGAIAFGYLHIGDQNLTKKVIEDLTFIGVGIALLLFGTIIYHMYRPIYNILVIRLHDKLRFNTHNYRTYLIKEYEGKISRYEAYPFWLVISGKYFPDEYKILSITASGIHLLYMAAFLAIPFLVWRIAAKDWTAVIVSFVAALVMFLCAFLHDRHHEDREYLLLRSLGKEKLDEIVKNFGFN